MKKRITTLLLAAFIISVFAMPLAAAPAYKDVPADEWYAEVVAEVSDLGLMTGVEDNLFAPDDATTRAMAIAIIHRMANQPASMPWKYSDVKVDHWFGEAVNWAGTYGISANDDGDKFRPNDQVTREEFAAMLYNYEVYKYGQPSVDQKLNNFVDEGEISDWAKTSMAWAVQEGVVAGRGNDDIAPQDNAKRSEMAAMIIKYLNVRR